MGRRLRRLRSTSDKRGVNEFYSYICKLQVHLYYPNFLNRYSRSKGDKEVKRIVLEENIKYPMFGDDDFKRPQYSADLIHQEAMKWLDVQTGEQPFCEIFTSPFPHAELTQPHDSIFTDKTWGGSENSRYNSAEHTHAHFASMITRLDTYVGEIFKKLKEKDWTKTQLFSSAATTVLMKKEELILNSSDATVNKEA